MEIPAINLKVSLELAPLNAGALRETFCDDGSCRALHLKTYCVVLD